MSAHITSTGIVRFGRRPEGLVDLLEAAGRIALEGVGRKPIDLLVVGNMAGGVLGEVENLAPRLADRLGLDSASAYRVEAASASGAAAAHVAIASILAGPSRRALVLAGEKMTDRPTADVAKVLARTLAPSEIAAGATMPALASLVTQAYLTRHDLAPTALTPVTVQARENSTRNPNAQFTTPVRPDEVESSRPVALPLRLLHCAAISDGAAAVVVERGRGAATALGLGQGIDNLMLVDRADWTSFRATRTAAQRAYEMARMTRKDVAFAELHDAFAPFACIDLEDIGICGPGEGPGWFDRGLTLPDGRFPVNPSGGCLGRGHPVGASGLVQIAEVARQLRGEAGPLQLPRRPRAGLAQSIGGLASHNFVTILGDAPGAA
ncbi:MAG: thiolase family protein [Thermoplasmata archaeon]